MAGLDDVDAEVVRIVRRVSATLLEQGAKATLLTGSHARGRARPDSDIDLFAIGDGPRERFEVIDGRLASVHWWTPETARQRMQTPATAFVAALGWRDAIIVDDPLGVGEELRREAHEWSWDKISGEADAWVCDELVGWAEYVIKLVAARESGRALDAGALRAETVVKLAQLLAVRLRIETQSENGLWETLAERGGPEIRKPLEAALAGERDAAFAGTIRLFELLAEDVRDLLDDAQRAVVEHAFAAARL